MGRHPNKETKEFMETYEKECQKDIPYKEAYRNAEKIHKDKTGSNKYKSIDSFKSSRSRRTKNRKKG